ncbi:hypothetical protein AS026_33700 [Rhizobium altiplani]|uniref:Uncharacterized protein n=1 Tax=Rhizobium altiplani TaxID=1864509 RepID=A0A120FP74_9HYPH|nr:hypothetical protein AS026_33700 [Rhizobium altiplani]
MNRGSVEDRVTAEKHGILLELFAFGGAGLLPAPHDAVHVIGGDLHVVLGVEYEAGYAVLICQFVGSCERPARRRVVTALWRFRLPTLLRLDISALAPISLVRRF